jgi:hypothetical protein
MNAFVRSCIDEKWPLSHLYSLFRVEPILGQRDVITTATCKRLLLPFYNAKTGDIGAALHNQNGFVAMTTHLLKKITGHQSRRFVRCSTGRARGGSGGKMLL